MPTRSKLVGQWRARLGEGRWCVLFSQGVDSSRKAHFVFPSVTYKGLSERACAPGSIVNGVLAEAVKSTDPVCLVCERALRAIRRTDLLMARIKRRAY